MPMTARKPQLQQLDFSQRSAVKQGNDDEYLLETGAVPYEQTSPAMEKIIRSRSTGKLKISESDVHDFHANDLELVAIGNDSGVIGEGAFGTVMRKRHVPSGKLMAVKTIRSAVNEKDQKSLLQELETMIRSDDSPYIVQFYGASFIEGQCWICMELMDLSLEQLYQTVYKHNERLPEPVIGKIAYATVHALSYLKDTHSIIHRDVKPSNILLNRAGDIKLCDFGIAGQLVDSIVRTRDVGCRPYMAPERLSLQKKTYGIRSDVWSLGISLVEIARGVFPYPEWKSVFDQLNQVVNGDPPMITPEDGYSLNFMNFVNKCLVKDEELRPRYHELLKTPFIVAAGSALVDMSAYVQSVLNKNIVTKRREQWTTFDN